MGVLLALACLVCAACNDFMFKLFANARGSRGVFMSVIGGIWFFALLWLPADWHTRLGATLLWGAVSGMFSFVGNVLLIEGMERQSAGICSTIYRLNMVLVVIGACWFLGETLSAAQWIGVALAVAAVGCFLGGDGIRRRSAAVGTLLVLAASVLRAAMGLSYKYGFDFAGADKNAVTVINSFFWIFGGIGYALWKRDFKTGLNRRMLVLGVVSGLLVAGIVFFMAASLAAGEASVVTPIAQMSFLVTLLMSVVFLKEKMTPMKSIGVGFGLAAILLLSLPL